MLGPVAVRDLAAVGRVLDLLEDVLHQVYGVVQIIVVHVADIDMDLALELLADLGPVALEDVAEVVVLAPVLGDRAVDHAGPLVPDPLGVSVRPDGRIDGLPDVPLLARSALGAEDQLVPVHALERRADVPEVVPHPRPGNLVPGALVEVGVLVLVEIDDRVGAEVDRDRGRRPSSRCTRRGRTSGRRAPPSRRSSRRRGTAPSRSRGTDTSSPGTGSARR